MTHRQKGDELLAFVSALDSPHRLRIIASLRESESYVSELARKLDLSRPLMHMHLGKLEAAGLVRSRQAFSSDGKALRYFSLVPFEELINADAIAEAVETLTSPSQERQAPE